MSQVVYRNELVQVVFVLTRITIGHIRIQFYQPVRVTGRASVGAFFVTLNPNPILTRPVNTI